ncbi:T9SS type A sorting domain-containing protein [Pedobacter sp. HMF7647]|uniref:T9SS type A sorting domain-containing protein n=1 Tax=Hufsiella arboris TaxID=2695275 RepID=A0A7K1YDV2_9SPHI|nr:T9SS type A sorting domain-containing protein [Hufsiella arboris]MXV52580.1 T9SS type A sorting domain-containing protein [Hufsiella arboris]
MKKFYLKVFVYSLFVCHLAVTQASAITSFQARDTSKVKQAGKYNGKIYDTRPNKPSYLKTTVGVDFTPFNPFNTKTSTLPGATPKNPQQDNDKILSNVKVFPNPVTDQINLSYHVTKESNVTIKIMDVLGNEVATLLSERTSSGEQLNTFNISSKLNSGFYFIRLMVGNETIVKRISVQ